MVTASFGRYGQRAARIGPDRKYRIRLPASVSAPFFQRRHRSCCAEPTRIRSGWPGQGLAKHSWSGSKLVCRNHRARFLAGLNRPATSFPLSDSVPFLRRRPGYYCAKPARIRFSSGWLCQGLAKRIRSGRKPTCKNDPARFCPVLPSRSGPDANRIRHVYWDNTWWHLCSAILWCIQTHCAWRHSLVYTNSLRFTTFSGVYKLTALDDILWCIQTHCALRHSLVYTNSLRFTTFSGVYKLTALYDILWCIQTHCALRHSLVYTNSLHFTTFSGVYKLTALYDILQHFLC